MEETEIDRMQETEKVLAMDGTELTK